MNIGEQLLHSAFSDDSRRTEAARRAKKKMALLANPAQLDKLVADFTQMVSPSKAKLSSDFALKTDAAEANIPDDHPLKGYGTQLKENIKGALISPENARYSVDQIVYGLAGSGLNIKGESGKSLIEESHKYKYKKDYAPLNWFGAFGEDDKVRALPGYQEYKDRQGALEVEEYHTGFLEAMGYGAGFEVGVRGLQKGLAKTMSKKMLGKWAAKRLAATAFGPAVGAAAVLAVPAFKVYDALQNVVEKSNFGRAYNDSWQMDVARGLVVGIAPAYGGHKLFRGIVAKAAEKDLIKGIAEKTLMQYPSARNAIRLGKDRAVAKAANEMVDTSIEGVKKSQAFSIAELFDRRTAAASSVEGYVKAYGGFESPFREGVKKTAPWTSKDVKRVFSSFTDEQADVAMQKAKTKGIKKATAEVKEGVDVVADQRLKEIKDGITKGVKAVMDEVDAAQIERYTTDDLLKNYKFSKGERLLKKTEKTAKKAAKAAAPVNDAVDKEILATKIAEVGEDIAASRLRLAEMGKRFKGGLVQTKSGAVVRKKGKKAVEQVPDEVVAKKEATIPVGMEEISYLQAKQKILAAQAKKQRPLKEEALKPVMKDHVEALEGSIGRKLTEAEMDDAEWLARAGNSETIEEMFQSADALTRKEFDPSKWKMFYIVAATVPLLSIFDGETQTAEASIGKVAVEVAAHSKVSKFVIDSLKATGRSVKELFKEIVDQGYAYIPAVEGQKFMGTRMKALSVSKMVKDRGERLVDQVTRVVDTPLGTSKFMGVAGFGRLFFKAGGDPAIELGSRHIAQGHMVEKHMKVFDNMMDDVLNYDRNPKNIIEAMKPLSDRFSVQVGAYNAIESKMATIKGIRKGFYEDLKKKKIKVDDKIALQKGIDEADSSLKILREARKELQGPAKQFQKEHEVMMKHLSDTHPAVRMSLAAEDTVDFKFRPWLKDKMTYSELEAVGYYKKFMEDYAETITGVMGKDSVIRSQPYIHHAFHPSQRKQFVIDELKRLKLDIPAAVPYTKFFSRSKYSRQMVTHIGFNTGRYIPDAEARIYMGGFWNKKSKDGWYSLSKSPIIKDSAPLRDFFNRLHEASKPAPDTWSNKAANTYVAIEVFRLLGFSSSVAFKHLFKLPGTWAQLGFGEAMKHIPQSVRVFSRTFSKGMRGRELAKQLGMQGKVGERAVTDLVTKTYSRQYGYMNTIMDLDLQVNPASTFDAALKFANEKGGVLVRAVEHFDRTHGVLAAMAMAAKRGMTAKDAAYGVVDTILKNNFLSGVLNPSWMRNPKIRALALFQNTAFKIMERRLIGAVKAADLIKTVGGEVKRQGLKNTLKELRGIKQFIREGEHEFKQSIIMDALNADRGYFGTPQSVQFMKEVLMAGGIMMAGGAGGMHLHEHVFHIPFMKGETKYPTLASSPVLNAVFDVTDNRAQAARDQLSPDFFIVDFLKEWLWQDKYGPVPQMMKKMIRLTNDDIPKRYKDSKLRYLFGAPSTEH